MGFNCLKATATSRRQFTFYHSVPRNSWYSFYRPRKDEKLGRPWSHPVVLNTGLLDWESSALTTRPLLHNLYSVFPFYVLLSHFVSYIHLFRKWRAEFPSIFGNANFQDACQFQCVQCLIWQRHVVFCQHVVYRKEKLKWGIFFIFAIIGRNFGICFSKLYQVVAIRWVKDGSFNLKTLRPLLFSE